MRLLRLRRVGKRALPVLVTVTILGGATAARAGPKTPVPDATAQAKARELIRDVYGKEFEATKTSVERTALAKKLLDQAAKSKGDPASHFVLLRIAKEVAVLAGDAQTAMEAVERTVQTYEVDAIQMKLECLRAVSQAAKSSSQRSALAEQAFSLVEAAVAEDNFQAAVEMGELARESALKAREFSLAKQIAARLKEVEKRKAAYGQYEQAMSRLRESPTDAEANLAAGRYVCLFQGEWDRGIPMLALGSDAALAALAAKELKGVASPESQVALGDGWWDLAQTKEGRERESFLLRAGHWYQEAQADVTSALVKAKLQKRLEEISEIKQAAAQLAGAKRPSRVRTLKPFDPATAEVLATLRGHTGAVRSVAFSPDGKTLASASEDRTVRFWDVAKGQLRGMLPPFKQRELRVAFSPSGSLVAVANGDHTVSLWDTAKGQFRGMLNAHKGRVFDVAFSPDGSMLASGSDDMTAILWDLAKGRPKWVTPGHGKRVRSLAFSPDGSTVASWAGGEPVRLWDVATGELRGTLEARTQYAQSIAFSPDGSTLAGATQGGAILMNVETGERLHTLAGHQPYVESVAFTPDGSTLASASSRDTVKLWHVPTGELRRTLEEHAAGVSSVAFSPDGLLLASGNKDLTVKLWGTPTTPAGPADRTRKPPDDRVVTRRIDFRRPDAIRQFILSKPENVGWNAKEKAMVIGSKKPGMAMATYGEHFRSISSVTVRGKIVPPSQHCLRIGVGPLSLLFNWSGGNQNRFHVWQGVTATEPHALTPGKMHEIQIAQKDELVVITLDGNQHHTTAARLDGTVTVYTGYGNTIAVSEIMIEGVPEPGVRVTKPSHRLY